MSKTKTSKRPKPAPVRVQPVVRPFVFLHIYDEATKHTLRGHWRTPHVRKIADLVLDWIDDDHAYICEPTSQIDYQI